MHKNEHPDYSPSPEIRSDSLPTHWWWRYPLIRAYYKKRNKVKEEGFSLPEPKPISRALVFFITATFLIFIARLIYLIASSSPTSEPGLFIQFYLPEWSYYVGAVIVSLIAVILPTTTLRMIFLTVQLPLAVLWVIEWSLCLVAMLLVVAIQIFIPLLLWGAFAVVFVGGGYSLSGTMGMAIATVGYLTILFTLGWRTILVVGDVVSSTWEKGWSTFDMLSRYYIPFPDKILKEFSLLVWYIGEWLGGDIEFDSF